MLSNPLKSFEIAHDFFTKVIQRIIQVITIRKQIHVVKGQHILFVL
jgi:hypothetical protein